MSELGDRPAYLGGPPAFADGPPAWPFPDPDVELSLRRAYADGSWGKYHGAFSVRLEETIRDRLRIPHVLLCGSGTFAVELALRATRVGPGDEVVLASFDFPGNILAVHAVGAFPVLADVDPSDWNLSLDSVERAIGPATRAVLVSHLHGGLVPMRSLMRLARDRGLAVIEDACQCPGAIVDGKFAGTWGDAGVFSFGGSKLLTAGRGGALVAESAEVAQRAKTALLRGNLVCPMSELQAAVLLPQWEKLAERNRRRAANAASLRELLAALPGLRPLAVRPDASEPAYYKFGLQFDAEAFGLSRRMFAAAMRAEGIAFDESFASQHIGRSPKRCRTVGTLHESERAHGGCLVLHHPILLDAADAMGNVAGAIRRIREHLPYFPRDVSEPVR